MSVLTDTPQGTRDAGEKLAEKILKAKKEKVVLSLEGDLGSGKTTFLQGLAKGLKIKEKVLSPTFVIIKSFKIPDPSFNKFFHIDCYRIKDLKEFKDLDLERILSDAGNIVAIEWGEKIKRILPEEKITIKFRIKGKSKREITTNKDAL